QRGVHQADRRRSRGVLSHAVATVGAVPGGLGDRHRRTWRAAGGAVRLLPVRLSHARSQRLGAVGRGERHPRAVQPLGDGVWADHGRIVLGNSKDQGSMTNEETSFLHLSLKKGPWSFLSSRLTCRQGPTPCPHKLIACVPMSRPPGRQRICWRRSTTTP